MENFNIDRIMNTLEQMKIADSLREQQKEEIETERLVNTLSVEIIEGKTPKQKYIKSLIRGC